jgi:hypothetical protein
VSAAPAWDLLRKLEAVPAPEAAQALLLVRHQRPSSSF